jgi:type II secretory pathway pseudopilin PulG
MGGGVTGILLAITLFIMRLVICIVTATCALLFGRDARAETLIVPLTSQVITSAYQTELGRTPSGDEINNWVNQSTANSITLSQFQTDLATSTEAANLLTQSYQSASGGQNPTPAQLSQWESDLAQYGLNYVKNEIGNSPGAAATSQVNLTNEILSILAPLQQQQQQQQQQQEQAAFSAQVIISLIEALYGSGGTGGGSFGYGGAPAGTTLVPVSSYTTINGNSLAGGNTNAASTLGGLTGSLGGLTGGGGLASLAQKREQTQGADPCGRMAHLRFACNNQCDNNETCLGECARSYSNCPSGQ